MHIPGLRQGLTAVLLLAISASGGAAAEPAASAGFYVTPWPAGRAVPQLVVTGLDGKVWNLKDLRGRAVLLNFWASWCEPCRAEMPSLQALAQLEGDMRLVVLAVNFKESSTAIARYAQAVQLQLPVLPDLQGTLARQWGVSVYPSTILIGADGRVRSTVRGEVDWMGSAAQRLVEPLLPKSP
ncbi:MAG: TlpA family protein disulfide reductase [Burkholderiales bacterium]|nr:TlpA family protein disulfide reductase [Burkholderiales bacterium]